MSLYHKHEIGNYVHLSPTSRRAPFYVVPHIHISHCHCPPPCAPCSCLILLQRRGSALQGPTQLEMDLHLSCRRSCSTAVFINRYQKMDLHLSCRRSCSTAVYMNRYQMSTHPDRRLLPAAGSAGWRTWTTRATCGRRDGGVPRRTAALCSLRSRTG